MKFHRIAYKIDGNPNKTMKNLWKYKDSHPKACKTNGKPKNSILEGGGGPESGFPLFL